MHEYASKRVCTHKWQCSARVAHSALALSQARLAVLTLLHKRVFFCYRSLSGAAAETAQIGV
eukprot:2069558-Pleurochrysis_carterae.AAC.1